MRSAWLFAVGLTCLLGGTPARAAEPEPLQRVEDVAGVSVKAERVIVKGLEATVLRALQTRVPALASLEVRDMGKEVQADAVQALGAFTHLRRLVLEGDADLDDAAFQVLGGMKPLRSLRIHLPRTSLSKTRVAALGALTRLEDLNLTGLLGYRALEAQVWDAIRETRRAERIEALGGRKAYETMEAELEAIEAQVKALEHQASVLRAQVAKLRKALAGDTKTAVAHHDGKSARITRRADDAGWWTVDFGSRAGIEVGDQLIVSRGPAYVATLEVKAVYDRSAKGVVIENLRKSDPILGDKVFCLED